MQWFFSGTWYDMSRTSDNYFVIQAINSQPLILPAQVKITSIFGDEVIDTVATSSFSVSICRIMATFGQVTLGCHWLLVLRQLWVSVLWDVVWKCRSAVLSSSSPTHLLR